MLSFILADHGSLPYKSSIYENGYEIYAKDNILISASSSVNINLHLILKCLENDFIYLVIDDQYQNILKIENNIIENNINSTYIIKIINLTNNNVSINKNNKLCHFYSKNKAYLHNTKVQNLVHKPEVQEEVAQEEVTQVVQEEVTPVVQEEVVQEEVVQEEVTQEEVTQEEVVEEVVQEEVTPVVQEEVTQVIQEEVTQVVQEEVVQEEVAPVVQEVVQENIDRDDLHEVINNTTNLENNINVTNLAKRKYIRKKKMTITLP